MNRRSNIEYLPSLLAANPLCFEKAIEKILETDIRQVHLDIMDGDFVPNISFGPAVVAAIKLQYPTLFREVHLMLSHPEKFISTFIQNGAQRIYIHIEIETEAWDTSVALLQKNSIEWGIAINPETSVEKLSSKKCFLDKCARVLMMGVHPGFSGQSFISSTYERIEQVKALFPHVRLCVDGGVNDENTQRMHQQGVSSFVVGSSFFKNA